MMTGTENFPEREYQFTLILGGVILTDPVLDALHNAGCNDATFSVQAGQLIGEFTRWAPSFDKAIATAIEQIIASGITTTVTSTDSL